MKGKSEILTRAINAMRQGKEFFVSWYKGLNGQQRRRLLEAVVKA